MYAALTSKEQQATERDKSQRRNRKQKEKKSKKAVSRECLSPVRMHRTSNSSQSATFLFFFARSADNLLLRMFSPSLGDVSVSAPVRSFLSHFPASSCFDWA